ncbi:hypothetical protein [Pseudomonas sp. H9]|uniref:hypothetical protein n=1 Tax=Pseudomonas sp. H9 TaxID=483968 RepID=UPI001057AC8B|nr:hypothetical protein [Pseudomonas sp. H9]TDF77416.1 hypothetical protein E1573_24995 [Pseudomonas sp. H9]
MDEIDDLTKEKLREWQIRRLDIKDQMQSHPEKTLELSRVLDLMDDEHAQILAAAVRVAAKAEEPEVVTAEHWQPPMAARFALQLQVAANSSEDLRKLLEMAVYELQGLIDAQDGEARTCPGGMSGTLGSYHFELGVSDKPAPQAPSIE